MDKKVENLNVKDYDEVDDILGELLFEHYGVIKHDFESLEKGTEYVTGTINIIKLGDKINTLKHNHNGIWSDDIDVTESYRNAEYYRLDKLSELCTNTLTGTWSETYNFNKLLNGQKR